MPLSLIFLFVRLNATTLLAFTLTSHLSDFFYFTPCAIQKKVINYSTSSRHQASLTQLVECHLAKVVVEGSNPLARSIFLPRRDGEMGA